jgi:hypothetical protein
MQTLVEFDQIGCKTRDIFFGGIRTLNQCVCKQFKFSIRLKGYELQTSYYHFSKQVYFL